MKKMNKKTKKKKSYKSKISKKCNQPAPPSLNFMLYHSKLKIINFSTNVSWFYLYYLTLLFTFYFIKRTQFLFIFWTGIIPKPCFENKFSSPLRTYSIFS